MWKKDPKIGTDLLREYEEGEAFCWLYNIIIIIYIILLVLQAKAYIAP